MIKRYLLQLLFVYPLIVLLASPINVILSYRGISGDLDEGTTFAGFESLSVLYVGLLVGWAMGRLQPSLLSSGMWLWLLPAVGIMADVGPGLLRSGTALSRFEYIYSSGNNEHLAVLFVTLPAFATLGYSTGMAFAAWERKCLKVPRAPQRAMQFTVWLATFLALVALMRNVEHRLVEHDKKLLIALGTRDVQIALDPRSLCKTAQSQTGGFFVVAGGTSFEASQTFLCSEGPRLFANDLPLQYGIRRPFTPEKVRVLNGPFRGKEGWVDTSQLYRPLRITEQSADAKGR